MPFSDLIEGVVKQWSDEQADKEKAAVQAKQDKEYAALEAFAVHLRTAIGPVLADLNAKPFDAKFEFAPYSGDPAPALYMAVKDPELPGCVFRIGSQPRGDAVVWTITPPFPQQVDARFDFKEIPSHNLATTLALCMGLCREQKRRNDNRERNIRRQEEEQQERNRAALERDEQERVFLARHEEQKAADRRAATIEARERIKAAVAESPWSWPEGVEIAIFTITLATNGNSCVGHSIDGKPVLLEDGTLWKARSAKNGKLVYWPATTSFTVVRTLAKEVTDLPADLLEDERVVLKDFRRPEGWGDWFEEADQEWERADGCTVWVSTGRKVPLAPVRDAITQLEESEDA